MKLNSFIQLPKKGISVRSILIFFYILLIGLVSLILIGINQYLLNHILIKYTMQIIKQTSAYLQTQVENYFAPVADNAIEAARYIHEGVITPGPSYKFKIYLHEVANDEPQIFSAFWATPQGDFYAIKRESRRNFEVWHIERSYNPPIYYYAKMNAANKISDIRRKLEERYDPRSRPWYTEAVAKKSLIWTDVYQSTLLMKDGKFPELISAAIPVYDQQNQLQGVFSVSITLDELVNFIKKIKISENSIVIIADRNNTLLAMEGGYNSDPHIGQKITPEVLKELRIKYPMKNIFAEAPNLKIREYADNGRYFVMQQILKATDSAWKVIIIVPESDILGPLKTIGLISALVMLTILILGIIIANIISKKIAAPIEELVHETESIKRFELEKPLLIKSKITEIQAIINAIDVMKKSLESFKRYVPLSIVKKLFKSGNIAEVGGVLKKVTLLFSDIKNFTSLTEVNPPEIVTSYLSEYLETMTKIVHQEFGTLDKYVGDLIMAFWGAPNKDNEQALHACQCAVTMIKQLKVLNEKWRNEGFSTIEIRIGINTGPAIVGNVGSSERLNYTALGDAVNLASRLEEVNKIYETCIIVSESTYKAVRTQFRFRFLDHIAVRGKRQGVYIYELEPLMSETELQKYNHEFKVAFTEYEKGNWNEAIVLFEKLAQAFPHEQVPKIFIQRSVELKKLNPSNWDGIWRLHE